MDHQEGLTCEKEKAYIDAGYVPITKGMHFWRWGAKIDTANKCNHLVSADILSLDPTLNNTANNTVVHDDDNVTIITFNHSPRKQINKTKVRERPSIVATACATFSNPMLQYLNVLTIAANRAIADTYATTIFIMDNTEVDNKRVATKPLKIN